MVCVNSFTHLIYICYIEFFFFAVISLILELKAVGMSNAIYAQYPTEIQDIIKQLYYTEDCEIDFHDDFSKTFWVYLFFKSTKAWKLLF